MKNMDSEIHKKIAKHLIENSFYGNYGSAVYTSENEKGETEITLVDCKSDLLKASEIKRN